MSYHASAGGTHLGVLLESVLPEHAWLLLSTETREGRKNFVLQHRSLGFVSEVAQTISIMMILLCFVGSLTRMLLTELRASIHGQMRKLV